jgi:hypothetical protein
LNRLAKPSLDIFVYVSRTMRGKVVEVEGEERKGKDQKKKTNLVSRTKAASFLVIFGSKPPL